MNSKCAHCGVTTPESMLSYGEFHDPACPATIARKFGGEFEVVDLGELLRIKPKPEPECCATKPEPWPEAEQHPNDRSVLLDEAGTLISGQRHADYGDARENFDRIAHGWAEILGHDVTRVQVALCMDWLKTCRLITSPHHRDSWLDKLGYTALGGEVSAL